MVIIFKQDKIICKKKVVYFAERIKIRIKQVSRSHVVADVI